MMVTFVMQVLPLACLREVYKVQIKQQKGIFSLEFYSLSKIPYYACQYVSKGN